MFFRGTLNAAIAAALQDSKHVVCFHSDDREESQTWENDYLHDESIQVYIKDQSVIVKLMKDSEEAGFLSQIVPLPKTPTLVIIHNANIKEYIPAGVGKAEFLRRVSQAFAPSQQPVVQTPPTSTENLGTSNDIAFSSSSGPETPPMTNNTPSVDSQLSDYRTATAEREAAQARAAAESRARRLAEEETRRAEEAEQQRIAEEAAGAARREREEIEALRQAEETERARTAREEGEARRKAAAEEAKRLRKEQGPRKPQLTPEEQRHRDEVAKTKAEKAAERKRILAAIEDRRAERRSREEEKRQERENMKAREAEEAAASAKAKAEKPVMLGIQSDDGSFCAVQVRLFGGRTVRAKFGPVSTLKEHVRPWVDEKIREQGSGHIPGYIFKMILTPLPNMALSPENDEPRTLRELNMMPSVTLVLVEAKTGSPGASRSVFTWPFNLLYTVLWRIWEFVFRFLGLRFLLSGSTATGSADTRNPGNKDGGEKGQKPSRVMASGVDRVDDTVRRRREQQQYYNGNSVNFESPPDDDKQG